MLTKQINKLQNNGTPTDAEVSRLLVPGLARFCCVHRGPVYTLYLCRSMVHRSLCPHLHTHSPPFSPSLIGLVVAVDVKHHVDWVRRPFPGDFDYQVHLFLDATEWLWALCAKALKSLFVTATEWLWALCAICFLMQLSGCEHFIQGALKSLCYCNWVTVSTLCNLFLNVADCEHFMQSALKSLC